MEELKDKVYKDSTAEQRKNVDLSPQSSNNTATNDFDIELGDLEVISTLGVGGFGRVELVKVFIEEIFLCCNNLPLPVSR